MQKLKIIHVIPCMLIHGAEKMAMETAIHHKQMGHDVIMVSQYARSGNAYEKNLEESGVRMVYFSKPLGLNFKHMHELTQFMEKEKPDVIHTHLYSAIYLVPYYLKDRKCAKIHTVHSVAEYELGPVHRLIQKFAYKFLGEIPVSISDSVKQSILKEYKGIKSTPLIYNGIDCSRFNIPHIEHEDIVIINVAGLSDVKNQGMLIKAFAQVKKTIKEARLRIVGEGEERVKLEGLIHDLKLEDCVELMGVRDDVEQLLAQADIFVLSSKKEGMPLSILEALAAGLPVISTDVGGARDVVKDGENGYIVPVDNIQAMSDRIKLLALDKAKRIEISQINRKYAENFDLLIMAEKYEELYYKVLEENK